MGIFKKRQYGVVTMPLDESNVPDVPDGTGVKCDKCGKILYKKYLTDNLNVLCFSFSIKLDTLGYAIASIKESITITASNSTNVKPFLFI